MTEGRTRSALVTRSTGPRTLVARTLIAEPKSPVGEGVRLPNSVSSVEVARNEPPRK